MNACDALPVKLSDVAYPLCPVLDDEGKKRAADIKEKLSGFPLP